MKLNDRIKSLKFLIVTIVMAVTTGGISGCATTMSGLECGVEPMNPTVMGALDSFESAAMAIRLSNRVLLQSPLSEQDSWPKDLYGVPDGAALFKMGLSLFASSQGITLATEIDPATGFPRPTSALYIFLKEREKLLDRDVSKIDLAYFKGKPQNIYFNELGNRRKEGTVNPYSYRNPLMAYGVVANNKDEMMQLETQIFLAANGYKQCDAFLRKADPNTTQELKEAACRDSGLKGEYLETVLKEKVSKKEEMEQNYGKLANKVYSASVAGADFSMAALVKIGCAIVNGVRAFPNINNEFKGIKGVYNAAMLFPRIKMIFGSLGIYKDNLTMQYTVYNTMYSQIKGKYQIKDEDPVDGNKTREALRRIQLAEGLMKKLEPKLQLALAGEPVQFSDNEVMQLETVAAMFPASDDMTRLAGL